MVKRKKGNNKTGKSSGRTAKKAKSTVTTGGDKVDTTIDNNAERPVIKSPLDTHGYKVVHQANNGLKGLLVSTCIHSSTLENASKSSKETRSCAFDQIFEFNQTHVNFKTKTSVQEAESEGEDEEEEEESLDSDENKTLKFLKATKKQQMAWASKRKRVRKVPKMSPKIKCTKGVHEQDDEMQSFCNTKCIGVLYVKAGFIQDPKELPGMAHFCEHAISLGSKNYPEIEAFTKFVEMNDGMYNARTEHECTIYYFYVNYEEITTALDMFSDMFTNPIFNRSGLKKEIDNINSEFEIKRMFDELRHLAIIQSCIREDHPANNFGFGSKDSLTDENIMAKLKKWIDTFYFGENMIFALQGPLPLENLNSLFEKFASNMPGKSDNSNITRPLPTPTKRRLHQPLPFDMEKWHQLYHMDILQSTNFMSISWPLDPKFGKDFETKPIYYFSYIFCHKGEGSLDRYLKQKGWITSLYVNTPDSSFFCTEFYTIFSISLELTAEGLEQRMEILKVVLKYVKLLQEKKASPSIFNEIQQLQADIFHYRSDMNLSDPTFGRRFDDRGVNETLWSLCHALSKTQVDEEVLLNTYLVRKFDAKVLDAFVRCLQPSNAMVVFAAKCFGKGATHNERWYQTGYYTKPMPQELIDEIRKGPAVPKLGFPQRNPFVAVSFCYQADKEIKYNKIKKRSDLLVYDSLKGYLTYGNSKCQRGLLPSAQYTIDFESPALEDDSHLINAPCSALFVSLLRYILEAELGPALCSLISLDIEGYPGFIRIVLSGPSPKLPDLAQKILATLENVKEQVGQYRNTIKDLSRIQIGFYKLLMNEPESCANELLHYLLSYRAYFLSDFVTMLEESIDHQTFLIFVSKFKKKLFINGYLNGCVTEHHAVQVAQRVGKFQCEPYVKKMEHNATDHTMQLPFGERCLLVSTKSTANRNVVVLNYYQLGSPSSREEKEMLLAISGYLGEICFEELRTKHSLGYYVEASLNVINGIYGVTVFVQGAADTHTCGYINERMDDFLHTAFNSSFPTPAKFQKTIIPWAKEGIKLGYKTTKDFYESHLISTGEHFRKLSVQIQGFQSKKSTPLKPSQLSTKVELYSSGKKLTRCSEGSTCGLSKYSNYLHLLLKDVKEENGYFITDVHKFKDDQTFLPNCEHLDFSDDDDEE